MIELIIKIAKEINNEDPNKPSIPRTQEIEAIYINNKIGYSLLILILLSIDIPYILCLSEN